MVDHRIETVVIAEANAGERLDRALALAISDLSRSRLKALILAGEVTIGGRTVRDPGHRVNAGDTVTVAMPPPEPAAPAPENIPLNIVFEDDEIVGIIHRAWGR
jgi:23S rRNA pseudouridine1911/1915/1917 synthase